MQNAETRRKAIDIAAENVYNQAVNAYKILVKEYFLRYRQTMQETLLRRHSIAAVQLCRAVRVTE